MVTNFKIYLLLLLPLLAGPASAETSSLSSIPMSENSARTENILGFSELEEVQGAGDRAGELFIEPGNKSALSLELVRTRTHQDLVKDHLFKSHLRVQSAGKDAASSFGYQD